MEGRNNLRKRRGNGRGEESKRYLQRRNKVRKRDNRNRQTEGGERRWGLRQQKRRI